MGLSANSSFKPNPEVPFPVRVIAPFQPSSGLHARGRLNYGVSPSTESSVSWQIILGLVASCGILGIGIFRTWKLKSHETAAKWGGATIVAGLLCSLFVSAYVKQGTSTEQLVFLSNAFLIIAGIGANLVASAATYNMKR